MVLHRDRVREEPGREVRGAHGADLARAHEAVERLERVLERDVRVGRVELVEVDVVDPEAAQARVAGGADPVRLQPGPAGVADGHADLRGQDHLVAAALQPGRERPLAEAVAVDVGGVDQRPAGIDEGVQHPVRVVLRGLAAHEHGAEGDARDPQ